MHGGFVQVWRTLGRCHDCGRFGIVDFMTDWPRPLYQCDACQQAAADR